MNTCYNVHAYIMNEGTNITDFVLKLAWRFIFKWLWVLFL